MRLTCGMTPSLQRVGKPSVVRDMDPSPARAVHPKPDLQYLVTHYVTIIQSAVLCDFLVR